MKMRLMVRSMCLVVTMWSVGACGDDATGPGGLDFPTLSNTVRNAFCVRGNLTVGATQSGNLSTSDCFEDDGYFEAYLVKVGSSRSVTFTLSSGFDGVMALVEVTNISDDDLDALDIAYVDDEFAGDDEVLSATLQAGRTYAIAVGGWDTSDVGPYTLRIR